MNAIKRIIITVITLMIIVLSIIGGVVFSKGYKIYNNAIEDTAVTKKVEKIQRDVNFTKLKDVSDDFLVAIVAIEDRRFYEHKGIDFIALGRALVNNIKAGEIIEGGSTITQQLAKNLYFDSEQKFTRKVAEVLLAKEIEGKYTKEEILELYINIIYYGNDSYGIKAATNGYFGKNPKDITYKEATLLAGVPQSPTYYDLTKNLDGAKVKQKYVEKAITENFK
ncbi:MAG: biosynthetic peptidoglycan transglycosylase [Sarcina sp.]